ncbi:hypothetical protein [Streptomyces sp. NPDC051684]|uniref:hypothetical protein n=1 Tax=Streptomyces sp. NPDC051684 TaxID=3365670 RepID=UPI00379138DA
MVLVHLATVRAGRALIGVVAALGVCLALTTPQIAAGVALKTRGRVESLHVTAVERAEEAAHSAARRLCSVSGGTATEPLTTQVWRGCTAAKQPGEQLAVVYDPKQRAPTRGLAAPGELRTAGLRLAALASLFAAVTAVTTVRSFRLTV